MKIKSLLCAAVVLFSALVTGAQATPVSATYTTSGSAGNWVYDFTFTNNITNQYVYFTGAQITGGTVTKMPAGWGTFNGYGVAGTTYNDIWIYNGAYSDAIAIGSSLSGFKVVSTAQTLQTTIKVFGYAYNYGAQYAGKDFQDGNAGNPAFVTTATLANATNVPEPGSIALLAVGMLGLGVAARKTASRNG